MTYDPELDPSAAFADVILGTSATYTRILDNHREVHETYTPPILSLPVFLTQTGTSYTERLAFRIRGNAGLHDVRFRVRAVATSGTGDVRLEVGANSTNIAISGAVAWYTDTVTMAAADADCLLYMRATSGGNSITVSALQVYLEVSAGSDGVWLDVDPAVWGAADMPVPSRVISELGAGPVKVAQDRPYLMVAHVSDLGAAISGKTVEGWGIDNSAIWTRVGRLMMPPMDRRPWLTQARVCRVDVAIVTDGTAEVEIGIGSTSWQFTASASGWYSTTLELSADAREVYANLIPGASDEAAVRTLQIWRGGA
jgi:hypothetical protein